MKPHCYTSKDLPTFMSWIVSLLFLSGCFQAVLRSPEEIRTNSDNDIVVAMKDGCRVRFASENYSVIDSAGRQAIRGQGKLYLPTSSQYRDFIGEISLNDIESISTSEKTTMFYVSIIAAGLVVGYVAFWLLALNGRGFGG